MNQSNKFLFEAREGAVRLMPAHRGKLPSPWTAVDQLDLGLSAEQEITGPGFQTAKTQVPPK